MGARPKARLYLNYQNDFCSINPSDDSEGFLVKFTSSQLSLGHDEGVCEAAYLTMAKQAGQANFANWEQAQLVIDEVVEAVQSFTRIANKLTINSEVTRLINKQLSNTYFENKLLLQKK